MSRAAAEVGSTANSYQILAKLATGGMAEIFLARGEGVANVERYCVLKRILRERASDVQFVRMFLDEARLAAQLQHPNIAQVYDIGKLGDSYFFTMEYVHGETVRALLHRAQGLRRPLPIPSILTIIAGAAAGLHHAHARVGPSGRALGIVHRDVSPSNLMVSYEGGVKLVDFGVAKAADRGHETKSGTVKGKIGYLSPEQCKGKKVDRRSDLFSLGICFWEMLTTERLYKRASDFDNMNAIVTEVTPPPSAKRADIPRELDELVGKLLAKSADDRFQTADEVVEAIEAVAARTGSVLSASALGKLIRELFGQRPEPWLELESHRELGEPVTVTSEPIPSDIVAPGSGGIEAQLSHVADLGPPRVVTESIHSFDAIGSDEAVEVPVTMVGRRPSGSTLGATGMPPLPTSRAGATESLVALPPASPSVPPPLPPQARATGPQPRVTAPQGTVSPPVRTTGPQGTVPPPVRTTGPQPLVTGQQAPLESPKPLTPAKPTGLQPTVIPPPRMAGPQAAVVPPGSDAYTPSSGSLLAPPGTFGPPAQRATPSAPFSAQPGSPSGSLQAPPGTFAGQLATPSASFVAQAGLIDGAGGPATPRTPTRRWPLYAVVAGAALAGSLAVALVMQSSGSAAKVSGVQPSAATQTTDGAVANQAAANASVTAEPINEPEKPAAGSAATDSAPAADAGSAASADAAGSIKVDAAGSNNVGSADSASAGSAGSAKADAAGLTSAGSAGSTNTSSAAATNTAKAKPALPPATHRTGSPLRASHLAAADEISQAYAAGQYAKVVELCGGSISADLAEPCVIAACHIGDDAKAHKLAAAAPAARRAQLLASCAKIAPDSKPKDDCEADPMACQH